MCVCVAGGGGLTTAAESVCTTVLLFHSRRGLTGKRRLAIVTKSERRRMATAKISIRLEGKKTPAYFNVIVRMEHQSRCSKKHENHVSPLFNGCNRS